MHAVFAILALALVTPEPLALIRATSASERRTVDDEVYREFSLWPSTATPGDLATMTHGARWRSRPGLVGRGLVDGGLVRSAARADPPVAASQPADPRPPRNHRPPGRDHAAALKRFGGNRKTEQAVADGLAWLAAHQRKDGVWDRRGFDQLCPEDDRCSQTAVTRMSKNADVGLTALATLPFLGTGHTHEQGPYAENLSKAFSFILAQQTPDGAYAPGGGLDIYNAAIATLAVAEAYALTKDPILEKPLHRCIRYLEKAQQPCGGWDYSADTRTERCDMSVTGWVLMAFKSAVATGAEVSLDTRLRLIDYLDRATEPNGLVEYANKGTGVELDPQSGHLSHRYGPAMMSVGLYARTALGFRLDDTIAQRQIEALLSDAPSLDRLRHRDPTGLHTEYYWYYGTLAMFNCGGEPWKKWNRALRNTILEYQERPVRKNGQRRHSYGSWPAFGPGWGKWGRPGSRIYSTAINVLTLEIYYRYEPAFLSPRTLVSIPEMREMIVGRRVGNAHLTNTDDDDDDRTVGNAHPTNADERRQRLLNLTLRLHPDLAEPLLLEFLAAPSPRIRLEAALELAHLGSPEGEPELRRQLRAADPVASARIRKALNQLKALAEQNARAKPAPCGKVTEINDHARMFLFDTNGQPIYYRQIVTVTRGGKPIARARVDRRFTGRQAAAAMLLDGTAKVELGDDVSTEAPGAGPADDPAKAAPKPTDNAPVKPKDLEAAKRDADD